MFCLCVFLWISSRYRFPPLSTSLIHSNSSQSLILWDFPPCHSFVRSSLKNAQPSSHKMKSCHYLCIVIVHFSFFRLVTMLTSNPFIGPSCSWRERGHRFAARTRCTGRKLRRGRRSLRCCLYIKAHLLAVPISMVFVYSFPQNTKLICTGRHGM